MDGATGRGSGFTAYLRFARWSIASHRIDGLAVGIAVFLSGGGAARRRDRREPRAGADVRQLAVRLGRADRRRPHRARDRLLGRRRARRPLARRPTCFIGAIALGAGSCSRSRSSTTGCSSRSSSWDPGPRLDPLVAAIALFGPPSVVLASVSPIAVRLAARSIDRLGRTAGRLFAISTAGSIAGTFATAFWLVPELGTDQVLAVGAVVLLAAAAVVALLERLLASRRRRSSAPRPPRARRRRPRARDGRDAPAGRRGAELVAALPRARHSHAAEARSGRGRAGRRRLHRPRRAGHPLPPARRRRRRGVPLPPLRQLVPERHVPRRPVPDAVRLHATTSTSGSRTARTRSGSSSSASAAAPRQKRMWRDFPRPPDHDGRARPGRRRRPPTRGSSCRATPGSRVEVEDGRRFLQKTTSAGT